MGPGLVLGIGYEFARHWQVGGYWGTGHHDDGSVMWNFGHLNFLVTAVAF
jgi:hypothetical protein